MPIGRPQLQAQQQRMIEALRSAAQSQQPTLGDIGLGFNIAAGQRVADPTAAIQAQVVQRTAPQIATAELETKIYDSMRKAAVMGDEDANAVFSEIQKYTTDPATIGQYARRLNEIDTPVNRGNAITEVARIAAERGDKPVSSGVSLQDIAKEAKAQADILDAEARIRGDLTPKEKVNFEQKLRKEFSDLSKEFIKQRDAYSRIQQSAQDPSAAGDLALIFNYMKLLDPGSVVRESEFANAQNAAGVPERTRALYNSVISGERLSEKTRRDFVDRANRLYTGARKQQDKNAEQFEGVAERAGVDIEDVVIDLGLAEDPALLSEVAGDIKQSLKGTIPIVQGTLNYADPRVQSAFDKGISEEEVLEYFKIMGY